MIGKFDAKDPNDDDLFALQCNGWLNPNETITSYNVVASPASLGLTVKSATCVGTSVQAWVSGGQASILYSLVFQITSSTGRYVERSAPLYVNYR